MKAVYIIYFQFIVLDIGIMKTQYHNLRMLIKQKVI